MLINGSVREHGIVAIESLLARPQMMALSEETLYEVFYWNFIYTTHDLPLFSGIKQMDIDSEIRRMAEERGYKPGNRAVWAVMDYNVLHSLLQEFWGRYKPEITGD